MNKEYIITEKSNLTNIAEAIRNKTKTTNGILLMDFPTLIENLGGAENNGLLEFLGATYSYSGSITLEKESSSFKLSVDSLDGIEANSMVKMAYIWKNEKETKVPDDQLSTATILDYFQFYINSNNNVRLGTYFTDDTFSNVEIMGSKIINGKVLYFSTMSDSQVTTDNINTITIKTSNDKPFAASTYNYIIFI